MTTLANHIELPAVLGRHIVLDERGIGLRATWRPAHGFVNLSLWRDDRCVETFHLTPDAASGLVSFLVASLARSVPRPSAPPLRAVPSDAPAPPGRRSARHVLARMKRGLADDLEAVAAWLRR